MKKEEADKRLQKGEIILQKVEYWKVKKPPTKSQFLMRKAMKDACSKAKDVKGNIIDKKTGKLMPMSAYKVKKILEDVTPGKIAREHPEWVEDYQKKYGSSLDKS